MILAGAPNTNRLTILSPESYEALIPVAGHPMVDFVVAALQNSSLVDEIVVVGPQELGYLRREKVTAVIPSQDTLIGNLQRGLDKFGPNELVLVATSDIPLLSTVAVDDFLIRAQEQPADFYYPIIEKSASEAKYPDSKRTYVRLRNGTFTGGNLLLLYPRILTGGWDWAADMYRLRKKPLKMCRLLGWGFLIQLLLGRLTIDSLEKRFQQLLGASGKAIVSPYPEIGLDVDKPADYELAIKYIGTTEIPAVGSVGV